MYWLFLFLAAISWAVEKPDCKRLPDLREIHLESATSPNIFNLWTDLRLVPASATLDSVRGFFGEIALSGESETSYRKTFEKHLKRRSTLDPLSPDQVRRAIFAADAELVRDIRTQRKAAGDSEFGRQLTEAYPIILATALAKYGDLIGSGIQLSGQDRSMAAGFLHELVLAWFAEKGVSFRKEKTTSERTPGYLEILPSESDLGKFSADLSKLHYKLAISPLVLLKFPDQSRAGIIDPRRKLLSLTVPMLIFIPPTDRERILGDLREYQKVSKSESPLGLKFRFGPSESWIESGNLPIVRNFILNQMDHALRDTDQFDARMEQVDLMLAENRKVVKAARKMENLLFPLIAEMTSSNGKWLLNRSELGPTFLVKIKPDNVLALYVKEGVWRLEEKASQFGATFQPRGAKTSKLAKRVETLMKAYVQQTISPSELAELSRLTFQLLQQFKRQNEVVAGIADYVGEKMQNFREELARVERDPDYPKAELLRMKEEMSKLNLKVVTLRTVPQKVTVSQLEAGAGAKKRPVDPMLSKFRLSAHEKAQWQKTRNEKTMNAFLDRMGMTSVIHLALARGWEWRDVSYDQVGYDIYLKNPKSGEEWFVEVKGRNRSGKRKSLTLEKSEVVFAAEHRENSVLAVAELDDEGVLELGFYRNFVSPPHPAQGKTQFFVQELKTHAEKIDLEMN